MCILAYAREDKFETDFLKVPILLDRGVSTWIFPFILETTIFWTIHLSNVNILLNLFLTWPLFFI